MSSPETNDLAAIVEALRSHDRFLVTTHENPDGDALGSLLAAKLALEQLGKDVVLYLSGTTPLPHEYGFMDLDSLRRTPPDDAADRVVLALDCANERRLGPDPAMLARAPLVLDVDHHHDNSRFGDVNLIVSDLERSDFDAAGAEEPFSEGIIDFLRAVEGTELVALIREPPTQNGPTRRISLRTRAEGIDVSAIARKSGGGGHRQAAGFSSEASVDEITEFIRREFLAQAGGDADH